MRFIVLSVVLMTFLTGCGVDWFPSDSTTSASSVSITTTTLADAPTGLSYGSTLVATGGTPPYHWSIASGLLPVVLTLSDGGLISGVPTTPTTFPTTFPATTPVFNFTVKVTDSAATAATTTKSFFISTPITTMDSTGKVFAYILSFDVTRGVTVTVMNTDSLVHTVLVEVANYDAAGLEVPGSAFTMLTPFIVPAGSSITNISTTTSNVPNNWRIKTVTVTQ